MKTRFKLVALMALAAVVAGCSEGDARMDDPEVPEKQSGSTPAHSDPPSDLVITTTDFELPSVPGDATEIPFEVNVDWTVSVEYDGDETEWLAVAPESGGAGKADLAITAQVNSHSTARKAFVNIAYGDQVRRLNVLQEGAEEVPEDEPEPKLVIHTNTNYENFYAHESYEEKIAFSVNTDWEVCIEYNCEESPDWLDITPLSGTAGDVELTMRLPENPSADLRSATVRITYGEEWWMNELFWVDQRGMNLTYIFDPEFSRILEKNGYIRNTHNIDPEEVRGIKRLVLQGAWNASEERYLGTLTSLKGLEYFESLEHLNCWGNRITTLDVSRNKHLEELWCYNNQITSLDVSGCPALEVLYCHSNPLSSLDVSRNPAMTAINCYNLQLTSLDVSGNPALVFLACDKNRVSSLDLSKNPALKTLDCSNNNLSSLDISRNPKIRQLRCIRNPGDGVTFPIRSWFDEHSIPTGMYVRFTEESWLHEGREITPHYRKVD